MRHHCGKIGDPYGSGENFGHICFTEYHWRYLFDYGLAVLIINASICLPNTAILVLDRKCKTIEKWLLLDLPFKSGIDQMMSMLICDYSTGRTNSAVLRNDIFFHPRRMSLHFVSASFPSRWNNCTGIYGQRCLYLWSFQNWGTDSLTVRGTNWSGCDGFPHFSTSNRCSPLSPIVTFVKV